MNDEFYTYKENIIEVLKEIGKDKKIWCPADTKDSAFVKVLLELGHTVYHTHIENYGEDFLNMTFYPEFDMIITNPPYSIKSEWIKNVLNMGNHFYY